MPLQSLFPSVQNTVQANTTGYTVPQGWTAINNNANDVYRDYLGFGRKRENPTSGAGFNNMPDIFGDLEQNKLYNQQQDQAFADKYKDQQIIKRQIGEALYEYGLLGKDGTITNNWTHQFSKDNWLDKNMPAITMAALAGMTGAGLFGQGGALAGAGEGIGAGSLATNPALIESAIGTAGYGASSAGAGGAGLLGSLFNGGLPQLSTGNSVADKLLGNVAKSFLGGGSGGISNLGNLSSLFSNYKQYSNTGKLMDEIKGIYSPDGPYAKRLEQELGRRDAAAGRNSQYGPRLEELMGRLGDSQARALQGLGPMMATQQGGLNGMLGAGNRLLGDFNLMDLFGGNSLGGMLAGEAGSTPDMWDRVSEDIDWESLFGG